MDVGEILTFHKQAVGALLGIEFVSASKSRVVAQMEITPRMFTHGDVVHGGVIMALADTANGMGAVLNLPPDSTTATIESKTNFLRRGKGEELRAESIPIHLGRRMSVWRASVYRGNGRPIAEVTQTQIVLPEQVVEGTARPPVRDVDIAETALPSHEAGPRDGGVAQDRRRQIFEGACQVITRAGFKGATIREIASAANMPVPTMYQYIDRKEDILYLIYEYFMHDYIETLKRILESDIAPARKLETCIYETLNSFDKNHKYLKLMFQETRSLSAEGRAKVYELDANYIQFWRDILTEVGSGDRTQVENAELSANFIYFLCAVWPLRYWTIGQYGRETVARDLSRFILRGLGLSPASA